MAARNSVAAPPAPGTRFKRRPLDGCSWRCEDDRRKGSGRGGGRGKRPSRWWPRVALATCTALVWRLRASELPTAQQTGYRTLTKVQPFCSCFFFFAHSVCVCECVCVRVWVCNSVRRNREVSAGFARPKVCVFRDGRLSRVAGL